MVLARCLLSLYAVVIGAGTEKAGLTITEKSKRRLYCSEREEAPVKWTEKEDYCSKQCVLRKASWRNASSPFFVGQCRLVSPDGSHYGMYRFDAATFGTVSRLNTFSGRQIALDPWIEQNCEYFIPAMDSKPNVALTAQN